MVLLKKNSHISFLHVYHHTAMAFFSWITMTYTKGEEISVKTLISMSQCDPIIYKSCHIRFIKNITYIKSVFIFTTKSYICFQC